jgi:ABC-2 type transport system ATP-binding protein
MIRAAALSKHYGSLVALDQVDLEVHPGEILGFLGPNGAGKSTALRILSGFLPPTAGAASIAGHDLVQASLRARAHLGYLPEHFLAPAELRVEEYLRFRARLKGLGRRAAREQVGSLARRLGFEDRLRQSFTALSKGYRQRIGLADALLGDPPALLLDEPFSGLDPLQRQEFRGFLRELADNGKAVLFSSHVLPEVEEVADRILILAGGRARAVGTLEDLRRLLHQEARLVLRVDGGGLAAARSTLEAQLGAATPVEELGDDRLAFRPGAEIDRRVLFAALAAADCGAVALQEEQPDLEQLFRLMVEQEAVA